MTLMYPDRVPAGTPRGEADMFSLIQQASGSDDYVCLHSVGITGHGRKEYAEADFVVIGPPGVFCIEAKGGEVTRVNGVWTIGPKGQTYTSDEGPFAQSEGTTHPLRVHLERELGLKRDEFLLGWGVAFPHISFSIRSTEWDLEVVYDERDKAKSFVEYIKRLAKHFSARRQKIGRPESPKLSPARVKQIASALRGDFELVPTVRGLLVDSKRELASLSAAQFAILDFALNDRNPQIICDGAAGTGKTLIAMEAARRLARGGRKVLLLCFNAQLGRFLAMDASEMGAAVTITTVHKFMSDLIRKGGFGTQLRAATSSDAAYFNRMMPDLFEKAAYALIEESGLPFYDVVIIDEAQDVLNAPIMNCIDMVLLDGFRNGRWLIFLDSGLQSKVYGRMSDEVLAYLRGSKPAEFLLCDNYRNPKAVVSEMCQVTGIEAPICRRTLVSNVDYRPYGDTREEGRKLRALLVELLHQGVPPGSISILSAKARQEACVTRHPPEIGKSICYIEDETVRCPTDSISAASVPAFKGLENEVIILTDLPSLEPKSDWTQSVLYVGMTRARAKLYMLVHQAYIDARTRC
ncbi:putative NERD domain protein [Mesorhizobium sp. ORS 3359]|nr:putative NERD domain protein [Mesorhizobium sp. ORS 3359]